MQINYFPTNIPISLSVITKTAGMYPAAVLNNFHPGATQSV